MVVLLQFLDPCLDHDPFLLIQRVKLIPHVLDPYHDPFLVGVQQGAS